MGTTAVDLGVCPKSREDPVGADPHKCPRPPMSEGQRAGWTGGVKGKEKR